MPDRSDPVTPPSQDPAVRRTELSDLASPEVDDADAVRGGATAEPCIRTPRGYIPCIKPGEVRPCIRSNG